MALLLIAIIITCLAGSILSMCRQLSKDVARFWPYASASFALYLAGQVAVYFLCKRFV